MCSLVIFCFDTDEQDFFLFSNDALFTERSARSGRCRRAVYVISDEFSDIYEAEVKTVKCFNKYTHFYAQETL